MKTLFFLMVTLIFVACNKEDSSDLYSDINSNTYYLQSNRTLQNYLTANFPSDELTESDYQQIGSRVIGNIYFSKNNQKITISPNENHFYSDETLSGELEHKRNGTLLYHIDCWAGGRFVLTKKEGGYEFELTLYGSGVPIVSSERGILTTTICENCD